MKQYEYAVVISISDLRGTPLLVRKLANVVEVGRQLATAFQGYSRDFNFVNLNNAIISIWENSAKRSFNPDADKIVQNLIDDLSRLNRLLGPIISHVENSDDEVVNLFSRQYSTKSWLIYCWPITYTLQIVLAKT